MDRDGFSLLSVFAIVFPATMSSLTAKNTTQIERFSDLSFQVPVFLFIFNHFSHATTRNRGPVPMFLQISTPNDSHFQFCSEFAQVKNDHIINMLVEF